MIAFMLLLPATMLDSCDISRPLGCITEAAKPHRNCNDSTANLHSTCIEPASNPHPTCVTDRDRHGQWVTVRDNDDRDPRSKTFGRRKRTSSASNLAKTVLGGLKPAEEIGRQLACAVHPRHLVLAAEHPP